MNFPMRFASCCIFVLGLASQSHAGTITHSLGDTGHGFADGQLLAIGDLLGLAPSAAPFDASIGSDPLSDFSATWTHTFGAITDTINSASITFGIFDSEGGSVGVDESDGDVVTLADEQLDFFTLGALDTSLKSDLIAAGFEDGGQGLNSQYEEYTVAIGGSLFADLATGSLDVDLGLKGPTFSPAVLVFLDDLVHDFNGARLVFSTLTIETQSTGGTVPEPSTLAIWSMIGVAVVLRTRKQKPQSPTV